MASTISAPLSLFSSSVAVDSNCSRQSANAPPSCVTLPAPSLPLHSHAARTNACYRKITRNVVAMATGEAEAETVETPEIVKTIQQTWDKVEDKYAVTGLAVAGVVALWGSTGVISAIDRLPLLPSVFELVGIGYTGWFVYKNLINSSDRDAVIQKIKDTYKDVTGTS
ncbi:hypothetical protein Leryth_007600 [Lithospermum erythrorhizon]|nr:hypothetical protein Leryth_007600 [Lithospermum erythrorhizon]